MPTPGGSIDATVSKTRFLEASIWTKSNHAPEHIIFNGNGTPKPERTNSPRKASGSARSARSNVSWMPLIDWLERCEQIGSPRRRDWSSSSSAPPLPRRGAHRVWTCGARRQRDLPLSMSTAAQRTDRSAAMNVASLAQISFSILLIGPPLLGLVSERWGFQWVFGLGIPFTLLSIVLAGKLDRKSGGRAALADPTY